MGPGLCEKGTSISLLDTGPGLRLSRGSWRQTWEVAAPGAVSREQVGPGECMCPGSCFGQHGDGLGCWTLSWALAGAEARVTWVGIVWCHAAP